MLSEKQAGVLEERARRATNGPLNVGEPGGPQGPFYMLVNPRGGVVAPQLLSPFDAEFFAHAREDVLALAADRAELQRQLAAEREARQKAEAACAALREALQTVMADARLVTRHLLHKMGKTVGYCRDCEAVGWASCAAHDEAVLARAAARGWDQPAEA